MFFMVAQPKVVSNRNEPQTKSNTYSNYVPPNNLRIGGGAINFSLRSTRSMQKLNNVQL